MSQVTHKPFVLNLENRIFDFLGKISYGIYVIHPLLIFICSKWYLSTNIDQFLPLTMQYIIVYLGITLLTIGISWLSYRYFEEPFLRLKSRYTIVKSTNSMSELK